MRRINIKKTKELTETELIDILFNEYIITLKNNKQYILNSNNIKSKVLDILLKHAAINLAKEIDNEILNQINDKQYNINVSK